MKKREMMHIARALLRSLQELPEKEREGAVAPFLAELRRLHKLPDAQAFMRIIDRVGNEMFGPREVSLTTAHRIPVALKEKIAEVLPNAEVRAVIDPRLIGGALLRLDDRIIDSSVTGMLERMKKVLLSR